MKEHLYVTNPYKFSFLLQPRLEIGARRGARRKNPANLGELENIIYGDSDVVSSFQRDISFNGDRYVVKLPFKPDHDLIPDNSDVCSKRLKSLKRKLAAKELIDDYGKIFEEYERDNIIERESDDKIMKEV